MNDMSENPRVAVGDNNPPTSIVAELRQNYAQLFSQFSELSDAAMTVPAKIEDDETHAKVLELIKKMRVALQQAEAARKIEVEPFKQRVDEVNGVFKSRIDNLKTVREGVDKKNEDYLLAKAAAEKRRLEEEAEKRRVESECLAREAQEAEQKRIEAQRQREEEERKAREAEAARARAVEERRIAEEAAEKARLEAIAMAERRKVAEAEEVLRRQRAKEQAEREEQDAEKRRAQTAAENEAHAKRMAEMRAEEDAAKERRRVADEEAAAARLKAEEERKRQREAEEQAAIAKRAETTAGRDSRDALDAAVREEKKADRIDEKANGPEADLARSRSEHGAVGSLGNRWECRLVDRRLVDIVALGPFIREDAIDAAGYKWMMAQEDHNRKMNGFVMEKVTGGIVR
jgi:chromosome segregation ATPase